MKNPIKNPLKPISKLFRKHPRLAPPLESDNDIKSRASRNAECEVIWPAGTWQFDAVRRADWPVMDFNIQCVLIDAWTQEQFAEAEQAAGRRLNPGMYGAAPPIRAGWTTSEEGLKALWAKHNWDVKYLHYTVARLQHLGRLE